MRYRIVFFLLIIPAFLYSQELVQINPSQAEGFPISNVSIVLVINEQEQAANESETNDFYKAFGIKPNAAFNQSVMDMAVKRILEEPNVTSAVYSVYNTNINSPVEIKLVINLTDEHKGEKVPKEKKGMASSKSLDDFPVLFETSRSKVQFIFNGAIGTYNESNAFFSKGSEFTQGNPVATEPAGKGVTYWGEAYIEPGLAGITQFGKGRNYVYGAFSVLVSGRNTTDIYSEGSALFTDIERLYGGFLFTGLGPDKDLNIDLSAGRNFFQLNDGFLIAKFSGSANAGERGSVYLNSRTAFEKTALLTIHKNRFNFKGFFLEPEELFPDKQSNTRYLGGSLNYNNNKNIDIGLSYIDVIGGTTIYTASSELIPKKGMYIINPRIWLTNLGNTGIFVKSEYAYQSHTSGDMSADAWYIGAGIATKWKGNPTFYYRYASMEGDDENSATYERFDPILTGGLGNWVQGINFRKVIGNGNIVSHRIEIKGKLSEKWDLTFDYFSLRADELNNKGGLAPISNLNAKDFGQEYTLNTRYFIGKHFMLMGLLSYAQPGDAIKKAFDDSIYSWTSVQCSLFMFF
ncbi:MAG TPA: hypothetical protein VLQ91_00345 [Draconibacterium sp.]|nr:hypothetical protein [Draconibacterium sp.]